MLPRSFSKGWVIVLIVLILVIIGSSFILSRQMSLTSPISPSSPNRVFPTEIGSQLNSDLKILYQDPNDKEGRTIIYTTSSKYAYNNSGEISFPGLRTYYIGLFDGWKKIAGSSDRELVLFDPINKAEIGQFRVVFQNNPVFSSASKTTRLSVENMVKARRVVDDEGSEDYERFLESVSAINDARLDKLIQKGDAMIVYPWQNPEGSSFTTIKDNDGRPYAYIILLRRTNGAVDIKGKI